MKPTYYIIRPEMGDELKDCCNASGPFDTVSEARDAIRRDAIECYLNCDKSLRNSTEDWGEKNYIVQVVGVVRPVPKAEISVRLTSVPIS